MYKQNFYSLEIDQEIKEIDKPNEKRKSSESSESSSQPQNIYVHQSQGQKLYFQKQQFNLAQFIPDQQQLITISSGDDDNQFKILSGEIMNKKNNLQNQIIQGSDVPQKQKENNCILISDEESYEESELVVLGQSSRYPSSFQNDTPSESQNQSNVNQDQNPYNNQLVIKEKIENNFQFNQSKPRQRTRQPYPQKSKTSTMKYIADNEFAIHILELFAHQGQIKVIFSDDHLENKIHKYYNSQKGDLAKFYQSEEMKEPDYFFITKDNKQYEFVNGKLQDKNTYLKVESLIFCPSKYQVIYEIINKMSIQLDPEFVKNLQIIVDVYVQMHQCGAQTNDIISHILSQNIKYLKIWETVKSHFKSVLIQKKNLVLHQKRISQSGLVSEKVKYKHLKMVEKQQLEIYQEIKIRPITYFLTKLFNIFEQIIYNEEHQIKVEEENQKQTKADFEQKVDIKN